MSRAPAHLSGPRVLGERQRDERQRDVQRILDRARSLVNDRASLVAPLVRSTGLSPAGVEHALLHHLEVGAAPEDIRRLVACAGDAPHVHVLLSANVFVAALRAIVLARAAAPQVTVRPSSRDPFFAEALVRALGDPAIRLVPDTIPAMTEGEIHVYGRNETIAKVRASAPPHVIVRGHGAGMGVACIWDDFDRAADALADDIVVFDQRGCLSPRLAFVSGVPAASFAEKLHASLAARELRIPRGELADDEREDARRYAETLRFAGVLYEGSAHLVGVAPRVVIPPTGRHLHIVPVAEIDALPDALAPLATSIVAIGATDAARRLAWPAHARLSALGAMQRPPLDGPVDRRLPHPASP
ncbi:acyl-CoA reductase [Pendulispora albinea]|uniref:Proline dehydrogenase n=1 Tax=Pendulispora albinea TaxID=2741071 RepID=A0ABZ2M1Z2_9BACT